MENGAYDRDWADVHMTPEQSIQAHLDLHGKTLMPIHNGTFDLALHPWYEPFERLSELAKSSNVPFITPIMGERVALKQTKTYQAWWRLAQ